MSINTLDAAKIADLSKGPKTPFIWQLAKRVIGATTPTLEINDMTLSHVATELGIIGTPNALKLRDMVLANIH